MNLRRMRWPVVLAAAVVALGALYGGQLLYAGQVVDRPAAAVLKGSPLVESFAVHWRADGPRVEVRLRPVEDLQSTWADLHRQLTQALGSGRFELVLQDGRNAELEQAYRRLNLHLQEGLVTGRFAEMAGRVEAEAAEMGLKASVSLDSERLYLHLAAENGYLYEVLTRPAPVGNRLSGEAGLQSARAGGMQL